jgi:hypothetical protein
MNWRLGGLAACTLALALTGGVWAADTKPAKDIASFGTMSAPQAEVVQAQAAAWLKSVGKTDAASTAAFEAIWKGNRPLLDKVTKTLELGDANVAKLMAEVRDPEQPAPTEVPGLIKDTKVAAFVRANLGVAYAKALLNRKVFDEAIEVLRAVKPEQTVDPASYFFTKAVAEFTLMMKKDAGDSVIRLLDDVADAPERYRMVAALMHLDMMTWQDKDLGWISRKMNVVKDRLEINRGGKKTQKIEREILVRLDEIIKELENQQKGSSSCSGGQCPNGGPSQGGQASGNRPSAPASESALPSGIASGTADKKEDRKLTQDWGNLPEKDRVAAQLELTRRVPEKYQGTIKNYMQNISNKSGGQ